MAELLPCPFCGKAPREDKMLGVWCANDDCSIVGQVFSGGARHWNNRAAPPPAGAQQAVAPMFYASPEQAAALQDRADDNEGGVYLPLRKTPAGKFTMPLFAAPAAAQGVDEALLRDLTQLASECSDHTPESFQRGVMALSTRAHKILRDADRARRLAEIAATPAPEAAPKLASGAIAIGSVHRDTLTTPEDRRHLNVGGAKLWPTSKALYNEEYVLVYSIPEAAPSAKEGEWRFFNVYADTEVRNAADSKLLAVICAGPDKKRILQAIKGLTPAGG